MHQSISKRTYTLVFAALMVLMVLTIGAALLPYHDWNMARLGVLIALAIATVKAVLVVLFFMHVLVSSRLTKMFVVAVTLWLGILVVLTFSDYLSRSWLPMSSGWNQQADRPRPIVAQPATATQH